MNLEYSRFNVKAKVKDEQGNIKEIPYTKDFDELLITENNIEIVDEILKNDRDTLRNLDNNALKKLGLYFLEITIYIVLIAIGSKLLFEHGFYYFWYLLHSGGYIGVPITYIVFAFLKRDNIKSYFQERGKLETSITFLEQEKNKFQKQIDELNLYQAKSHALHTGFIVMNPVDISETKKYLLNLKKELLEDYKRNKNLYDSLENKLDNCLTCNSDESMLTKDDINSIDCEIKKMFKDKEVLGRSRKL